MVAAAAENDLTSRDRVGDNLPCREVAMYYPPNSLPMSHPTFPDSPCSPCPDTDRHQPLRQPLLERLLELPFPAFVACIGQLLTAMGYERVQPRGTSPGRNLFGGHDLEGSYAAGLSPLRFLAQAKQYKEPVPRCFVDELRGAMLRLSAGQGIIFTTSFFSPSACLAAHTGSLAPIRLVESEELLDLLLSRHVGIRRDPDKAGTWKLDEDFFASLTGERPNRIQMSHKSPPVSRTARRAEGHGCKQGTSAAGLTITLSLKAPPRPSRP